MRLPAVLLALLALTAPASAAAPDIAKPRYAIVRARFTPKQTLPDPGGPDPYIGIKVKGDVMVARTLSGRLAHKRFAAELWLPKMSGPLDLYLLLETAWEGSPEIYAFSPVRDGFCIRPEQALDGPVKDVMRLRRQHPCKRKS